MTYWSIIQLNHAKLFPTLEHKTYGQIHWKSYGVGAITFKFDISVYEW